MRVCIYGSSSNQTNPKYVEQARVLGELIAKRNHVCVSGAGLYGVMGGVCDGNIAHNGRIKGVIHEKFCVDGEDAHHGIKDIVICRGDDLTERKQLLLDNGDCFLVMPGGVGTFDEFWEAICAKSLGFKRLQLKPFCLVNLDGFYDGFIMQMRRAYEDGILYSNVESYFHVADSVEGALEWCEAEVEKAHRFGADVTVPNHKDINHRVKERDARASQSHEHHRHHSRHHGPSGSSSLSHTLSWAVIFALGVTAGVLYSRRQ